MLRHAFFIVVNLIESETIILHYKGSTVVEKTDKQRCEELGIELVEKLIDQKEYDHNKNIESHRVQYNRMKGTRPPTRGPCDIPLALKDYVAGKNMIHIGGARGSMTSWWDQAGAKSYIGIEIGGHMEKDLAAAVEDVNNRNNIETFRYACPVSFWDVFGNDKQIQGAFSHSAAAYSDHNNIEQTSKINSDQLRTLFRDEVDLVYFWSVRKSKPLPEEVTEEFYTKEELNISDRHARDRSILIRKIKEYIKRPMTVITFCGDDFNQALLYKPDTIVKYQSKELAEDWIQHGPWPHKARGADWRRTCNIYLAVNCLNTSS